MANFLPDEVEPPAPAAQDASTEGDFLRVVAEQPSTANYEALQYKAAYPEFDLNHIAQNIDFFRRQSRVDRVNWDAVAAQHPVLKKYMQDPDKAGLAMQSSALLTGAQRWIGGKTPNYIDQGKPDEPDWRWTAPAWLQRANDWAGATLPWTVDKLASIPWDVMDWGADKAARLTGMEKGGFFADQARYWNQRAALYEPYKPGNKDYYGSSFRETGSVVRAANYL